MFGEQARKLVFGSTKSMTGHLLGAAGALEFVVSLLAVDPRRDPAHHQPVHTRPGVRPRLRPEQDGRGGRVALSNSFGFGGHNVALRLRAGLHVDPCRCSALPEPQLSGVHTGAGELHRSGVRGTRWSRSAIA